jgi:thiol-disulfide isomerase/thioredoxin
MFHRSVTSTLLAGALLACSNPRDADIPFGGEPLPDFVLSDLNPNSETFEEDLSPRAAEGAVSLWYFTHATCPYCQSQFDILYTLQAELDEQYGAGAVQIFGVNAAGYESGIPDITEGNSLPLLQDVDSVDAWDAWYSEWRDLVVVDEDNAWVGLFNLTSHDLADAGNLTDLRAMIEPELESD